MRKSLTTAFFVGLAAVLAGAAALVGATSVSTEPAPAFVTHMAPTTTSTTIAPRVVVPTTVDDHGGERGRFPSPSDSSDR